MILLHLLLLLKLLDFGLIEVGELSEDALQVLSEFSLRCDPEGPVDKFQKLCLKQVHFLQADAAHEG